MDVRDVAGLLRVDVKVVHRLIRQKKIPAYKLEKGKYLISTRQLIEFIEAKVNSQEYSQG